MRQGLVWAFGYNMLLIPVAAGCCTWWHGLLLDPVLAAGAMAMLERERGLERAAAAGLPRRLNRSGDAMNELEMAPMAKDPVCGMEVNPEVATAQGLSSEHEGETYYFCGRGCKLDFDENPQTYFDPGYTPSM